MFRTHLLDRAGIFIRNRDSGRYFSLIATQQDGVWQVSGLGSEPLAFGRWVSVRFDGKEVKMRFRKMPFMNRASLEVWVDAPKIVEISPLCRPLKKKVDKAG